MRARVWFCRAALLCAVLLTSPRLFAGAQPTNAPAAKASTNAEPRFRVDEYEVLGNTLLPQKTVEGIFSKHTGTNITFDDVTAGLKALQLEYHNRGYDTVSVTIPQQRLTNGVFRVRVFEGRLVEILVKGNNYYSSNNILRSLPSLRTNVYLNSKVFQAELDRANANQDRQVYPEIHPGPDPDTSSLWLVVQDRLPVHGKIEANNQSSPGTPEQRLNSSLVYNDLWQLDHSVGIQYSFSEEDFKAGDQWRFYDKPLVANYSAFYRMPLGAPSAVGQDVEANPTAFGYNEATRKFELPTTTGAPEFNFYASRSTIDSGANIVAFRNLYVSQTGDLRIDQQTVHEDLTINEGVGMRFSMPTPDFYGVQSHLQAGMDLKWYDISSFETNYFLFTQVLTRPNGTTFTLGTKTPAKTAPTFKQITYLPLAFRWDAHRDDSMGGTDFGLGYNPNVYFTGGRKNVQLISGSEQSTGYWHILTGTLTREQTLYREWKLNLHADGQWASEPLISNEQFGVGGIAGVRGYREGEVFADYGWRVTSELQTPTHRIGFAGEGTSWPLTVRASIFMDYAQADMLDPRGGRTTTPLWGTGIAGVAQMGSTFDAHLGFTWPLTSTPDSEAGQLRVIFAVSAQF